MKRFILEKEYEGEWYYEGTYSENTINALAQCIFWLGRNGCIYDGIRVTVRDV